jgi:hypothetical protein
MSRPFAALAMLACAYALVGPASALAKGSAAEIPEVAVAEAQRVTRGPDHGIATAASTPRLWATVNVCDTAASPDSMGVRAGMPGNASGQRMFMRFRAEYWSSSRQDWAAVAGVGVSPWVYVGPARYERRQAGWTFEFSPPPAGVTFTMRAIVEFQWRKAGEPVARDAGAKRTPTAQPKLVQRRSPHHRSSDSRVVRTVTRATETGIPGVDGGEPVGTSKAMCLIH